MITYFWWYPAIWLWCDKTLFKLRLENWHPSAFSDDYICIHMLIYRQNIIAVWYLYFIILFVQLCLKYGLYYLKIWYIWRCKDWNVSDAQIVKFAPKCFLRQQYLHLSPIVQGRVYNVLAYAFLYYSFLPAFF